MISFEYNNNPKGQKGGGALLLGMWQPLRWTKVDLWTVYRAWHLEAWLCSQENLHICGKRTGGDESLGCSSDFIFSFMSERTLAFYDFIIFLLWYRGQFECPLPTKERVNKILPKVITVSLLRYRNQTNYLTRGKGRATNLYYYYYYWPEGILRWR